MVKYLGMDFEVVDETPLSVTIRRACLSSADNDIVIMKDSPRYEAIFKPKTPFTFADLIADAEKELPSFTNRDGKPNIDYNGKFYKFLQNYAVETTQHESSTQALEAMENEIRNDSTGLYMFVLATFAYQNSTRFKDSSKIAKAADIYKNQKHEHYNKELLDYYLAQTQIHKPTKEQDIKELCSIIPKEYGAECIQAICGFDFGADSDWIISFKQAQTLFNKLY